MASTTGRVVFGGYPNQTSERKSLMFSIQEFRKNNGARQPISSFVAHFAAMILVLTMVLAPSTASAGRPPTPRNFRVTTTTAYTVTLSWEPAPPNSGSFNYYLWG